VATSYANSGGTGNRTSLIRVNDNGVINGGTLTGAKLVDGTLTDQGWFVSGQTAAWIEFDFSAIGKVVIDAFRIYGSAATANGTWKLSGWDPTTGAWVQIATGLVWAGNSGGFGTPNELTFSNSTAYQVYRLDQTAGTTTSGPDYSEIEFKIETSGSSDYTWGTGDRTSTITVTGGASTFSGGLTGPKLVNGTIANNEGWLNSGQSASFIDFDLLGVSRKCQGFAWYSDGPTSQGTWKIQGWDGGAWVDIATGIALAAPGTGILRPGIFRFNSQTGYTKFRLQQTGGTTSSSPNVSEVELFTASPTAALTATDLAVGSPALDAPTIGQTHALTATDLAVGSPVLDTPAIGQTHALAATDLAVGSPELDTPATGQLQNLTSQDLETTGPTLGAPDVGQVHVLAAPALEPSGPVLDVPALGQVHGLAVPDLAVGAPVLGAPALVLLYDPPAPAVFEGRGAATFEGAAPAPAQFTGSP
jgi:hypothetical protein